MEEPHVEDSELDALRIQLIAYLHESPFLADVTARDAWLLRCLPMRYANQLIGMLEHKPGDKRDHLTLILADTQGRRRRLSANSNPLIWLILFQDVSEDAAELGTYPDYQALLQQLEQLDQEINPPAPPEGDKLPETPRGRALRAWGFRIDPFINDSGAQDIDLLEYFWTEHGYLDVAGETKSRTGVNFEPVIVLGAPGAGKSTLRNAIVQNARRKKRILPVVFDDFSWLRSQAKILAPLPLELYLRQVVRYTAQTLANDIALGQLTRSPEWDGLRELRHFLYQYFEHFPTNPDHRIRLRTFLDPSGADSIDWDSSIPEVLLEDFCSAICSLFNFDRVYLLVDPSFSAAELKWEVLQPLVSAYGFIWRPVGQVAFKFFLDDSYSAAVRRVEWVRSSDRAIHLLNWDDDDLEKMLAERIKLSAVGQQFASLEAIANGVPKMDRTLVSLSKQNPRRLIKLCNQLFRRHIDDDRGPTPISGDEFSQLVADHSDVLEKNWPQDILDGSARLDDQTLRWVVQGDEGLQVEFKAAAFIETREASEIGRDDWKPQEAVMMEIAAFANTRGGILVIGVNDDQSVFGLEREFERHKRSGRPEDQFRLALTNAMNHYLEPYPMSSIDIQYRNYSGAKVCTIQVAPSPEPIYVKHSEGDDVYYFFVRKLNRTHKLDARDTVEYMGKRFQDKCPVCGRIKRQPKPKSV